MLDFANTFLNSIKYSQDENRMKGGFPMNKYGDFKQDRNANDNGIIYGGDDGTIQMQEKTYDINRGSFVVPIGLVYFPPPLCDYNNKHVLSEDIPVISDKHFDSLFALVSSQSNPKLSSRKNRRIPFTKTKKNTK